VIAPVCCFSRPVERVEQTRIFARGSGGRQLIVYELKLAAAEDLAMVLPLPVVAGSGEDAIAFVDLDTSPTFFSGLDQAFRPAAASGELSAQSRSLGAPLPVHQVGSFEASFVPRADDFDRLDPRFAIPSSLWATLPSVRSYGFVVFKMRMPAPPRPPLLARLFGNVEPPPLRAFHPMAFWFPRAQRERIFFPTLHVHDGRVHASATFDHVLYAQSDRAPEGWERSIHPVRDAVGGAARELLLEQPVQRHVLTGSLPNVDVWING
jgi:hypothetical protein